VDATLRPEFGIVSVSTNGISLAEDPDLIRALRDRGVVISLQFDGVLEETYHRLRGRGDLAAIKLRLIDQMLALGAQFSLTMTLAKGVNEPELPGVLRLLFNHDQILSLMVQPLSHHGEYLQNPTADFQETMTISETVRLLAEASAGVLRESDFTPLPCSHPSCFALAYLLKTDDQRLVSLPSVIELEPYLDIIKNQALLNTNTDSLIQIKDALYSLWSASGQIPNRESVLKTIKQILLDINRIGPSAAPREVLSLGPRHVKSVFIHQFMDRFTFDLSRVIKCCNHYPQADGRLLPACVRNNLGCGTAIQTQSSR
jgi:7,8-dihydro-6-hydroxymethylpterin dimethyltransferase